MNAYIQPKQELSSHCTS